ncbi:putative salivary secreted peptide [Andrena cerasifolii]|uniref:putative salivary secreted peptide n=1 Tax=Andrena cerasifolii TaxID=2819439 RepID=UPI0040379CE9
MSAPKLLFYLAIVTVTVLSAQVGSSPLETFGSQSNKDSSHDLVVGYRLPGDRLVLRQSVIKNSSWMRVVVVEKSFSISEFDRITLLQALDQKTNGNGAYASILEGGPGHSNVTMRFKSQRGHGINFIVELYSRP